MVICFNATQESKRALDSLLETGQFKDMSEVISMALVNYGVIQHAMKENQQIFHAQTSPKSELCETPGKAVVLDANAAEHFRMPGAEVARQIPALFQLPPSPPNDADLLSQEPNPTDYKSLSPKDWFFGQWNRFLPAKATCRALLNIMSKQHSGIPVNDAAGKISYGACDLGDYLRMLDARHSRRREDSVSAAFPSTSTLGAESRLRYGNQFVGTIKQGKLIGLPGALRLVGHDSAKDPNLRLTKAGATFAALQNPLLDAGIAGSSDKFSTDEIHFLLQHIQSFVPEEVSAFSAIIDAITEGADTPDKMDAFLRVRFGFDDEAAMTATFLSTQRTGAISRLADLGLVGRQKTGLRVTYFVTHPGKCFRSQLQ